MIDEYPARAFVGRKQELALLDHLAAGADRGVRVVLLSGQGGVGKTTLLNEYRQRIVGGYELTARTVPIVDLANITHRSLDSVMDEIADAPALDPEAFAPYNDDVTAFSGRCVRWHLFEKGRVL